MQPTLVIMAAGMGSRFGGLKQLAPFGPGGATLMEYSIFDALQAGFGKIVLIVRSETENQFREALQERWSKRLPLHYSHQEIQNLPDGYQVPSHRKKPWGTGQAVLTTRDLVTEPFAVINADDFYGADAFKALAVFLANKPSSVSSIPTYAMVGYRLRNTMTESGTVSRGVCLANEKNELMSIEEITAIEKVGENGRTRNEDGTLRDLPGDACVSMNIWGFNPGLFDLLETSFRSFLDQNIKEEKAEFYLPEMIQGAIKNDQARVSILPASSSWFGVTYPQDQARVEETLARLTTEGVYPREPWA